MFKAALFDLDGVVFDTEPQYTHFWGDQAREFFKDTPGLEREIKGQTLVQIYDKYFCGEKARLRGLITERLDAFERDMTFDYVVGFEAFVRDLRSHDVRTAVVTSSNKEKMKNVYRKRPEFKSSFDFILTSEDFTESKPSPDCYVKAAERIGVSFRECIVFEDSFNGLLSGRAARMTVVGLATTNAAADILPYSDMVIADYTGMDYHKCSLLVETND